MLGPIGNTKIGEGAQRLLKPVAGVIVNASNRIRPGSTAQSPRKVSLESPRGLLYASPGIGASQASNPRLPDSTRSSLRSAAGSSTHEMSTTRRGSFTIKDPDAKKHAWSSVTHNCHVVTSWGVDRNELPKKCGLKEGGGTSEIIKRDNSLHNLYTDNMHPEKKYSQNPDANRHNHVKYSSRDSMMQSLERHFPDFATKIKQGLPTSHQDV